VSKSKLTPLVGLLVTMPAASAAATPASYVRVSDEQTHTVSAFVEQATWVRELPGPTARRLARLEPWTWHGSPEVVLELGKTDVAGSEWSHVRYSGVGVRRGWIRTSVLSARRVHDTRLVLDLRRLRIRLYRGDRLLLSSPVGVGARGSPTPRGRFYIRERIVPTRRNSTYGPLAFGISAFSRHRTDWPGGGQVGIHGTNQPSLIPGYISNGCVRLRNRNILRLGGLIRVGTPLLVK
jgi:lipoprotein-anchoring transpeptidase ErfK/SrfK